MFLSIFINFSHSWVSEEIPKIATQESPSIEIAVRQLHYYKEAN